MKDVVATAPTGTAPVAWLRSSRDCLLEGVRSPGARTLARLSGRETAKVRVVGDAGTPQQVVILDPDVADALRTQGNVTSKSWSEERRAAGSDSGQTLRLVD